MGKLEYFMIFVVVTMFVLNTVTIFSFNEDMVNNVYKIDKLYETKAIHNLKQDNTKIIGDYCLLYKNNLSRVRCVHNFVVDSELFNYTKTKYVVLADELIQNGGDCKSWTVFYKAIFNYMGIDSNYIHTDSHVYLNAFDDTFYCNIDQKQIECTMFNKDEDTQQ